MRLIDADQLRAMNQRHILGIVGIALGTEGHSAGIIGGDLGDTVGDGSSAVAHGIVEADHIPVLNLLRLGGMADDQITGFKGTAHGVRQDDHGEYPAYGGNLAVPGIALD